MYFNRKGNRKFFTDKLLFKTVGIIFLVGIPVLIITDFRLYQKKHELVSQIEAYKKQIEDIKKSSQILKDEIANFDNKDYLEKIGYEQFGQARPGETEYMFVDSIKNQQENATPVKRNFWDAKSWFGWLSGWIKNAF